MLETLLNSGTESTTLDLNTILISTAVALLLGFMISITYIKTNKAHYSRGLSMTLILLPMLISTIVLIIGSNIAGAFSLAGIFSIIRFRSAPGTSKDIVHILFCVGAGLACGMKLPLYGIFFTVVVCTVLIILNMTGFLKQKHTDMKLTILVPECLNNENVFDDVLEKYTKKYELSRMRTKDFGSIFELTFQIDFLENSKKSQMIDELRCRNGNLNISLSMATESEEF